MRKRMFMHTVWDDSVLGTLKFVAKTNPKKARKQKKPASPSKKQTRVIIEKPAKKPASRRQPTGVQIKDTPDVSVSKKKAPAKAKRNRGIDLLSKATLLKEAQLKKAIQRSKQETHMHQAGGSGDGAGLEPMVLDEPKGKSIDTHEITGLKPRVPKVPKADSLDSKYESWGVSDDDDDDQQGDDERTESDDDKSVDLNKTDDEEETHEDELVHTPDDYVPTDDETHDVNDEEYDRINEEIYDDVNVELKDVELTDKGKWDEEMTDAKKVASSSRFVSSNYGGIFLNLVNISSVDTEIISMLDVQVQHENLTPITAEATTSTTAIPESTTFSAIHQRVSDLEKEVKILKNVDHNLAIYATIKSEVLIVVKECLGTNMEDSLHKVMHRQTTEFVKEHIVPVAAIAKKRTLFETMTKSKSFDRNPKHGDLYHALVESILKDDDAMDKDQGLKRRKTIKDVKPSKKVKSNDTSKGTTKSQPKSTRKSDQAEERVFEATDTQLPQNLGEDMGKTDEPPIFKDYPKDWFKKPKRPPTPNPE
nr:hypothetical protein [Tanacetum cinerariifolium]